MKRKSVSKVLVNGTAYLFSVILLLSMVAAPVIASVSANSVGTYHIKDNSILNRDIAPNKISSSRIKDYTIVKEDIHSASINKYKLVTGAVNSAKILDGSILDRDIANGAVNTSKIEDGAVNSAKIEDGAVNSAKIKDGAIKDEGLSTKKGYLSITPAALSAIQDGYDYSKHSTVRINSGTVASFYAPVQLPDGAVVTKLRYSAFDNNGGVLEYTSAMLTRVRHSDQVAQNRATASTNGLASSTSWRIVSDSTISNPIIDNNTYAYYIKVYLSDPSNLFGGNIVIEYTYKR